MMTIWKKYMSKIVKAESGKDSKVMNIFATPGNDKIINVPVGVTVYDEFMRKIGNNTLLLLCDCVII